MIYEAVFAKEKTYWWDEDGSGWCIFSAEDDETALSFVATVVQRMNRKYWRMREQRNVHVKGVSRLEEHGLSVGRVVVPLWGIMRPLAGFRSTRRALEAFYPKESDGRKRSSIAGMFNDWNSISVPTFGS